MRLTIKQLSVHRVLLNQCHPRKNNRFALFLANDMITLLLNYTGTHVVTGKGSELYSFHVGY
jgi:hypothetical protein